MGRRGSPSRDYKEEHVVGGSGASSGYNARAVPGWTIADISDGDTRDSM
jgi:hypothetical protein